MYVMKQYYKTIKGKKYDRGLLDLAEASTKGKGDGRISLTDARRILKQVRDSDQYTGIEKRTMSHIRAHYKFTAEADAWFRTEVKRWAASRKPKPAAPRKKAASAKRPAVKRPTPAAGEFPEDAAPAFVPRPAPPAARKSSLGWKLLVLVSVIIVAIIAFLKLPQLQRFLPERLPMKPEKPSLPGAETTPQAEKQTQEPIAGSMPEKKPVLEKESKPQLPEGSYYTVEPKDSLIGIAEKLTGDYRNWIKLYQANRGIIKSPIMIFTGQKLVIPEELRGKKQ